MYGKQKEVRFTKLESQQPITESWIEFRKAIPISVPAEMFAIIKQAYFTGALSLYMSMIRGMDDTTDEETPLDLLKMERIHKELFAYMNNMREFLESAMLECEERKKAQ